MMIERRVFLKTAAAAMLTAPLCNRLRALAGDSLEELCLQGAQERNIQLTPSMNRRLTEEVAEFRLANAEPGLIRIASVARALKQRGHVIAAGLGHTPSSFVAHLLGFSEINPTDHRITFDLVVPRKSGVEVMVGLALEQAALEEFLRILDPRQKKPYLVFGPDWVGTDCFVGAVKLYLVPLPDLPGRYFGVDRDYIEDFLGTYFDWYLEALSPHSDEETALALSLWRLGLTTPRVFEDVLTRSLAIQGNDPVIYRGDAIRLLMKARGVTRIEAASILEASEHTPSNQRCPEYADKVLPYLRVRTFRHIQKTAALNGAAHLRSTDPRLRRMARLHYSSGAVRDFLRAGWVTGLVRNRPESRNVIARLARM